MRLRPARAVLLLIFAATALRLVLAAITDLGLDEAYALAVSRHFQLSWFDHPPLTFWIAGAMQALFGPDVPVLVLRLPFIALSAATTWLLFRLTERHFGEAAALWAAALFTAAPFFFLSAGSWLVPDGPLAFFLVVAALALTDIVLNDTRSPQWRNWLLAGAALGLALLSKYHAGLFALGAAVYFVARPSLRFWLLRPQPYVAIFVALVLFIPVLVWNAQNDWASFAFQLGRGAAVGGSSPEIIARLFLTEAAYLLPTTALLLVAALIWAVTKRSVSIGFFLALALPIIAALDATRFWTWQSYAHWSMPGWMLLLPVVGAMLAQWPRRWTTVVGGVTALQFVLLIAGVVLLLSDFRIRDPGIDRFRVEAGSWTSVAEGIEASGELDGAAFILARRWPDAARIAEATRLSLPVLVFDADARGFAWPVDQQSLVGSDALIVAHAGEMTGVMELYHDYFESFGPVASYAVESGNPNTIEVVRGIGLKQPYPLPYGAP
jgi:4-amino-4-deoxy-L-arabinose transferase-like glycosyltransferase